MAKAEKNQNADVVRKITVTTINAKPDIEVLLKQPQKRMVLANIFGIVRRAKPEAGKDGRGDYVRFYGQFKAVNLHSGEVFMSGAMILPGVVQDALYGALGDDVQGVEFAVEVGCKYNADAVTKYEYFARSLIAPKETDPLVMLEARLSGQKLLGKAADDSK